MNRFVWDVTSSINEAIFCYFITVPSRLPNIDDKEKENHIIEKYKPLLFSEHHCNIYSNIIILITLYNKVQPLLKMKECIKNYSLFIYFNHN